MSGRIDWNVVMLGRVLGAVVIVFGIALAAWQAIRLGDVGFPNQTEYQVRFFLESTLSRLATGGLLIVAAEIADRLGWGARRESEATGEEATS